MRNGMRALVVAAVLGGILSSWHEARADEATVIVGGPPFAPPPDGQTAVDPRSTRATDDLLARDPELYRSSFRISLGPAGITTGKGFGLGVGVGADIGTGSVGGRIAAAWLRGEGKTDSGASTPTGDSVGQYTAEITLDLHKRGPIHPIFGMGAGALHVSRADGKSGFAGIGTGRLALDYALGLDDADVRVGAGITAGLLGPVDDEIKPLHAYALTDVHLAIGF